MFKYIVLALAFGMVVADQTMQMSEMDKKKAGMAMKVRATVIGPRNQALWIEFCLLNLFEWKSNAFSLLELQVLTMDVKDMIACQSDSDCAAHADKPKCSVMFKLCRPADLPAFQAIGRCFEIKKKIFSISTVHGEKLKDSNLCWTEVKDF